MRSIYVDIFNILIPQELFLFFFGLLYTVTYLISDRRFLICKYVTTKSCVLRCCLSIALILTTAILYWNNAVLKCQVHIGTGQKQAVSILETAVGLGIFLYAGMIAKKVIILSAFSKRKDGIGMHHPMTIGKLFGRQFLAMDLTQ